MKANASSKKVGEPDVAQELRELVRRAEAGDTTVLPRLNEILDEYPEVWHRLGDLAGVARSAWVELLVGGDLVARESIQRRADQLREELAGPHPTPTESLLADQITTCWLEAHHASLHLAQCADRTTAQGVYWLRRAEIAQRKYVSALKTLTTLRAVHPSGLAAPHGLKVFRGEGRKRA